MAIEMSTRKNHHYIPKFYLKRFSVNAEGKCIALYNIKNKLLIQNAPIKHQACREFLYGTDDFIEAELAKLENIISRMFYHWTEEKIFVPPPQNTGAFVLLKKFILSQLFRTIKEGNDTEELVNQAFEAFISVYHPEKKSQLTGGRVHFGDAVLFNVLYSFDKQYILDFLECRFIVNLSQLPFITSDTPVVKYNQLMESIGLYTGATGLAAKGLQIFYPIHPWLMICLYDPVVYSCGVNSKNCVSTESIDDIHQLNALQYLNCNSQLFFDEKISPDYINLIIKQFGQTKCNIGPTSNLSKLPNKNYYFFTSFEDAQIHLSLTFFTILEKARDFKYEMAPLRHPSFEMRPPD